MIDTLPDEAKQPRYAVFRANRRTETKKSFRPITRILMKDWEAKALKTTDNLRAYLHELAGPGCYMIEPYDEHNQRMTKVAAWCVHTNPEVTMGYDPEDDDDDELDDEPRGRRFRRRYRDDVHDDDYLEERANVADVLATATRAQTAQTMQAQNSKDSMMSMLLLTQTQGAATRAEEDRRREDRLAEERKLERDRQDRLEREAKDRQERQDRLDREDRERKDKEDAQRRQDERDERNREEQRRRDEDARRAASDAKRTEVMVAAITGIAPLLIGLMKREPTPPPAADPMAMILLKSIVDRTDKADSSQVMFTQMGEMAKLQTTIMSEQMRSSMNMSSEMNSAVMKKAMEMMMASPHGQSPEGKTMIEQIMMAVQGASELVKTLAPPPPPATIVHQQPPLLQAPQNPNRRFARGGAETQQQPVQQQPQPAQQQPEQQSPVGIHGVMHALRGIQTKAWQTNEEYQTFVQYIFSQIPLAARVAILDGNDIELYRLTKPAIDADALLTAWVGLPETLPWMRQFIPTLKPTIEQVFGAAQQQRDQLAYLVQQGGEQGMQLALATPADFQAWIDANKGEEQPPEGVPAAAPVAEAPVEGAAAEVPAPGTPPAEAAPVEPQPGAPASTELDV